MIRRYTFFVDGQKTLEFDDSKTVKELIEYAFNVFEYYEPAGIGLVTLFQCHHSKSYTGWFTRDTNSICADEIENPDELCFAYQLPDVFYFAEGGWGHHMIELGNHPPIPNPVAIKIRFEDFANTVVINSQYSFYDIISFLTNTHYISNCRRVLVNPVGIPNGPYSIRLDDDILQLNLKDFLDEIEMLNNQYYPNHGFIYYEEFEIR